MNSVKYLSLLLTLISTLNLNAQESADSLNGVTVYEAENVSTQVVIKLYENQDVNGNLGFSVFIEGWYKNDNVSLIAVSPNKEQISLLKESATLPTTENGTLQFSIPYSHDNLYPGEWILAVIGKSGTHGHIFKVPMK